MDCSIFFAVVSYSFVCFGTMVRKGVKVVGFINAGPFFGIVSSYRLCWIAGRFGGGKTSFAYALAQRFLDSGYKLITNNLSIWADDIQDAQLNKDGKLKAVVLLDEGGTELKASIQMEQICAYARKMDVIYLIPSFWPPARAAQVLVVQPLFNLMAAGLPIIIYRWRVKSGAFTDTGIFYWTFPSSIYGVYSSNDPGDRLSEITSFLNERKEQYRELFGRGGTNEISDLGEEVTTLSILQDAAGTFEEASDNLLSLSRRKGKRGRL